VFGAIPSEAAASLPFHDYATGRRTPKDSACWYKGVIANNGDNLYESEVSAGGL
jgi:hypothetical protein